MRVNNGLLIIVRFNFPVKVYLHCFKDARGKQKKSSQVRLVLPLPIIAFSK